MESVSSDYAKQAFEKAQHLLDPQIDRIPQESLHLLCSSLDGHVKDLLAKFHHQSTKNGRVNLAKAN